MHKTICAGRPMFHSSNPLRNGKLGFPNHVPPDFHHPPRGMHRRVRLELERDHLDPAIHQLPHVPLRMLHPALLRWHEYL